jgi:hypothetical protein
MGSDSPTTIFPRILGPDAATPYPFSIHAQYAATPSPLVILIHRGEISLII